MSNAKEMPVPATTEQARAEESVNSTADYSTDSATLQEGNSFIAIIPPIPSVHERPKPPRKQDIMGKLSNTLRQATDLQNAGADTSAVNAFLKGAMKAETKPRLKQATLENILDGMGIRVSYNRISQEVSFSGVNRHFPKLKEQDYFTGLPVKLCDMLCDEYRRAEKGDIEDYLTVISLENGYNPVLSYIEAEPWDGVNRFPELFGIMGVRDDLPRTLIHKWSLQAIALLNNSIDRDYSADGMLTFNGRQGIGKTRLSRVLAMQSRWFRDGAKFRTGDKDSLIETTRYFISEFGELERVLKPSQMADFKQFVTSSVDEYRVAYGRRSTKNPRFTSFIGTCNSPEFLVDDENRRFWVVRLTQVDLDALERFNAAQFWRQVYREWKGEESNGRGGTCYRLTPGERAALSEQNTLYQTPLDWQAELEEIIDPARADKFNEYAWEWTNVADWIRHWPTLKECKLQAKDITPALNRMNIEKNEKSVRSRVTGKPLGKGKARLLPFRQGEVKRVMEEMEPL